MKGGKVGKVSAAAAALLAIGVIMAVMMTSAYDYDQTYIANATYFVPEDIRVAGYCNEETVSIWVNTSVALGAGAVKFYYDPNCMNVTGYVGNSSNWNAINEANLQYGWVTIGFSNTYKGGIGPGLVHIGDITVHCNDTGGCCGTLIYWDTDPTVSYLQDTENVKIPVNWKNATFLCGTPMVVTKKVLDPSTGEWVDALGPLPSEWKGKDVIFNITVTAKCLDLENVKVSDVMDERLKYNNSASLTPDSYDEHSVNWTISSLSAGTSQSITFNATIVDYGTGVDTATVSATVSNLGVLVSAEDSASVTTMPPARIIVNKTVWDPDAGAWVEGIDDAKIGETYRFRCVITNGGSPGMDLTNITVWDILSPSMEYADDAVLTTPAGTTWNISSPTSITTLPDGSTMVNWTIDDYLPSPLTLLVGQSLVIEFNATVVNYGMDINTQFAKGWCDDVNAWIVGNDTAYINTPKPDLVVSDITINYDASSVKNKAVGPLPPGTKTQCNNLSATISELNGVDVVFPFNVKFEVNGVELNCSPVRVPAGALKGGDSIKVYCDCSFYPIAGETYNISAVADSDDEIIESNETNNRGWRNVTAIWNGYKGDGWQDGRNISTSQCHEQGTINLTYSTGDSYYQSGGAGAWTTYEANWTASDFNIPPEGTNIVKARLYVYYCWDKTEDVGGDGDPTNASDGYYVNLTFNGYPKMHIAHYTDRKGFGWWDYPFGMIVYDVTNEFVATGNNKAVLTYTWPSGAYKDLSITGMLLAVVYNNTNEPERIIWINEGFDMIYAKTSYGISSEEATTYAEFEGCEPIPLHEVVSAKLVTVAPHASDGDDKNRLYFNGHLWKGIWNKYPPCPPGKPASPELGINETDVRAYLKATDNIAAFQSHIPEGATKGDFMAASNAFLIVEKGKAEIAVEVPAECIGQGEQFIVNVTVDPRGIPIYGVEYEISFDPTVLHAEWQNEGDFLKQDGASTNVYINNIDNTAGKLTFAVTRVGTQTGVTTPGILARIDFTALKQGASTTLTFTKVKMSDPDANSVPAESVNGTVYVCENLPPVAVGWSEFRYNNVGSKYLSKAYFNASKSYDQDADGCITNYRWAFGDGNYGTGMTTEHIYDSWKWNGSSYEPFTVILTVEDDGTPILDNSTSFPVNVFIAGDANGDGVVDIFDAVIVGLEWDKTANFNGEIYWYDNERGDRADLNNDKTVDIFDAVIVGANWEHTAW